MQIKDRIIKWLGGFTTKEYNKIVVEEDKVELIPVYAETNNYYIDDDALNFEKEQLAYKIGKEMLEHGLISYTIKQKEDDFGQKIYAIRAKACINKIK